MDWIIFFSVAVAFLVGAIVFAVIRSQSKYKRGRVLDGSRIMFGGVIFSSVILFIPIYLNTFKGTECGIFETILISIHNMIRLFIVDGEYLFITENMQGIPQWLTAPYTALFAILFVLAPVLTFSFVLSFFKNISSYTRFLFNFGKDAYIFSELNEKSLALAETISAKHGKKCVFIFTDVFEREEEESFELIEQGKELGAIFFKKDIINVNFSRHSAKSALNFFCIGENETENIAQALNLILKHKYRKNTLLYVFSTQLEAELLLTNAFVGEGDMSEEQNEDMIKVRRVNHVRSLINHNLYDKGYEMLFHSAYDDGSGTKQINAVVVGMGQHGVEMTKALAWCCQMDGYRLEVDVVDSRADAEKEFLSQCPELMKMNGRHDDKGDAQYTIRIHSGMNVNTYDFDQMIIGLPRTTYVFVALGSDEMNIAVAVKLRALFLQQGIHPKIQAVVYSSEKKVALQNIANFKGASYDIDFIGDMRSAFSEKVILESDVEQAALKRHTRWGTVSDFWRFDYNYKSSVASAIHRMLKSKCGIPGIDKEPKERTEQELWGIRQLEHRRWNAYMRTEGYVYSGSPEKASRNDLAKMHNCLVPFNDLPLSEQEKDDD